MFLFRTIDPGDYTVRGSAVLLSDRLVLWLLVRPTAQNGVGFNYQDQWLPQVRGTGAWVKDAYLLSGRCARSRTNIACHLRPIWC